MNDFNSLLNSMFWSMLIGGLLQLAVLIFLIVKFVGMTNDVQALRKSLTESSKDDFRKEFYKWYACGNIDKAKEVLANAIGSSSEFQQLLRGGNDTYLAKIKEELLKKFQIELQLTGIQLNFDGWIK